MIEEIQEIHLEGKEIEKVLKRLQKEISNGIQISLSEYFHSKLIVLTENVLTTRVMKQFVDRELLIRGSLCVRNFKIIF